jgi:hypothetical protein
VRTKKKPQISPLRFAPVEMTNLFELRKVVHRLEKPQFTQNKFVISTGAKRSGEICGFFLVLTQTLKAESCCMVYVRAEARTLQKKRASGPGGLINRISHGTAQAVPFVLTFSVAWHLVRFSRDVGYHRS